MSAAAPAQRIELSHGVVLQLIAAEYDGRCCCCSRDHRVSAGVYYAHGLVVCQTCAPAKGRREQLELLIEHARNARRGRPAPRSRR